MIRLYRLKDCYEKDLWDFLKVTLDTLAEDVNFVKYLYFGQLSDNLHDPHDNLEITYMIRVFFQILALSAFTQTVLISKSNSI